jgi:uncharacterized protein (TIGR02646 family)
VWYHKIIKHIYKFNISRLYKSEQRGFIIDYLRRMRGDRCTYCGKILAESDMTIEHIRPKSKGGRNDINNLTIACQDCNCKRASMPVATFMGSAKH